MKVPTVLKTVLKFSLVVGLFYFLFQKGLISTQVFERAFSEWPLLLGAACLSLLGQGLGIWRWQLLLRSQGIHLSFVRTVELSFIGLFFNVALPGAVSGDVVKAIYVASEAPGKRARAMSSIVFDRVVGVSCLVLVGSISLLLIWGSPSALRIVGSIQAFLIACGCGVIAFYTYLFALTGKWDPIHRGLHRLGERVPSLGGLSRIYDGIREYRLHKRTVVSCLILSSLIHVMVVTQFWLLALSIGENHVPLLALAVVVPLGLLVTAIPILPGGVGTGHAAFLFFLGILGSERGADLFNLNLIFTLTFAVVGGLVYLRFKKGAQLVHPRGYAPHSHQSP